MTALTVWSMYAISKTSVATAATTPSLNIMQMMRDAKNLRVESYDACACQF
jgi:hypothetical protein